MRILLIILSSFLLLGLVFSGCTTNPANITIENSVNYPIQTTTESLSSTITATQNTTITTTTTSQYSSFLISDLTVNPAQVTPCEDVTIGVSATNTGKDPGNLDVILSINGIEEDRENIILGAGDTKDVFFIVARDDAGTYVVAIDGLAGSFSVVSD